MNPLQKVPVLKDGDFTLTESVAMFRYLAREKEVEDHWYPREARAQARVDEYLEWQHLGTRMNCAGYFQQVNTLYMYHVLYLKSVLLL